MTASLHFTLRLMNLRGTKTPHGWRMTCSSLKEPFLVEADTSEEGTSGEPAAHRLVATILRENADEAEAMCLDGQRRGENPEQHMKNWRNLKRSSAPEAFGESIRTGATLTMEWELPVRILLDEAWNGEGHIADHVVGAESIFPKGLSTSGRWAFQLLIPRLYRALADMYENHVFAKGTPKYCKSTYEAAPAT